MHHNHVGFVMLFSSMKSLGGLSCIHALSLRCILDFERTRNQRQESDFSGEVALMRWFSIAFFANGIFIVPLFGFELTTHVP